MACSFTDRIRYGQTLSGFQSPTNVTDTEEMSPLKLVPARRRAQDARGHDAERSRPGRPQNRKNGPPAQAQPRAQTRLQPREKAQEKARQHAPAAASGEIPPEGERLNKHLARTGVCSRREADDWIARGWVRINGRPVERGQKVMPGDVVEVRQAARARQQDKVTILLNKPVGYVSGQAEDGYRPAVTLIDAQATRTRAVSSAASCVGWRWRAGWIAIRWGFWC